MTDARKQQAAEALERANSMRFGKAQFKRDVRAGKTDPVQALLGDLPPYLEKTEVWEYLAWVPFLGPIRARSLVKDMGIAGTMLRSLTAKRREVVALRLRDWLQAQERRGAREVMRAA